MDLQLEGKCALVTGSSRGLGEAMARSLAAEGVKVIVHGRNKEAAEEVAHSIGGSDRVAVVLGDLAEAGTVERTHGCRRIGLVDLRRANLVRNRALAEQDMSAKRGQPDPGDGGGNEEQFLDHGAPLTATFQ